MITPKDLEELKYTAPTHVAVQPLTEASRSFLTGQRAIPEAVLATFKVASASDGRMILPLQRADGEVVGIKYRHETGGKLNVLSAGRSETITEDFEPKGLEILFGTHLCNPEKNSTLHPFCHEFDSMAGAAAGLVNCAAIPNTQTDKFEFIRNQYDWLRKFKKIVIAPPILKDAEKKDELKEQLDLLRRRLDAGRVFEVQAASYGECLSINGLFAKNGTEAVQRAVSEAVHHEDPDFEYLLDGKSDKPKDGIATGWSLIDKSTGGLHPGQYIVIGGNTGHGKTTSVLNMIARMLKANKVVFWHGVEGKNDDIRTGINRIVAGPAMLDSHVGEETGAEFYYANNEAVKLIQEKYRRNLINLEGKKFQKATLETYFEKAQYAVDRFGVDVLVIDNLMG